MKKGSSKKSYRAKTSGGSKKKASTKSTSTSATKGTSFPWKKYAGKALTGVGNLSLSMLKQKLGLNTEIHCVENPASNVPLSATWATQYNILGVAVPQGLTTATRVGDSFRVTLWAIRATLKNGAGNALISKVRLVLVRFPNAAASAITQVFQVSTDINSPFTVDSTIRFNVISDTTFCLSPAGSGPQLFDFDSNYTPDESSGHLKFTTADTTGVAGNVTSGYVVLYGIVDQFTAANAPSMDMTGRLRFVDN